MRGPSEKQKEIFSFIRKRIEEAGYPPSVREICSAVGLSSPSTVHAHLKTLERHGLIVSEAGKKRAISLPGDSERKYVQVPLLGTVTAGVPILAVEQIESYIPIRYETARGRELFALNVLGDSMIDAAILDGDIVIVEKTPVANNGEIVVAMLEDEATVKRFYRENGHFRLQPENSSYEPIISDSVTILGRVICVIRNL